jgi:hypothetical protein
MWTSENPSSRTFVNKGKKKGRARVAPTLPRASLRYGYYLTRYLELTRRALSAARP